MELASELGSELPLIILKLMVLGSEEAEVFCLDGGMKRTDEEHSEGAANKVKPEGCGAMKPTGVGTPTL